MSTERTILAACQTCEWSSSSPNARATAKSHATRHRHDVNVVETVEHRYAGPLPGQTSLDFDLEPAPA